jgi:hypothetical protein
MVRTALDWLFHQDARPTKKHGSETTVIPLPSSRSNSYFISWCMRSLLADIRIHRDPWLKEQTLLILQNYDHWNPSARLEKELKYRLEPIRSKL